MTNMTISDNVSAQLEMLAEVQDQIKVLTAQKSKIQTQVLTDLGMDESAPIGTSSFEDAEGSVRAKVAVADDLVIDSDGVAGAIKALAKAGLMDTVVTVSYKVSKTTFEKLPDAKKSLLAPFVSYRRKKPTLSVL